MIKPLGAHVSASGGVGNAPINAHEIGADAFAFFTKNQKQWKAPPLKDEDIESFGSELGNAKIEPKHVLPHDSYLINLGHPEAQKLAISRKAFLVEMERVEQLGLTLLNFHPGSHLKQISEEECLERIGESVNRTLDATQTAVAVLEITAGQGSNLGYKLEHLAAIMGMVDQKERVGVCIDTAHAFAAGYAIHEKSGFDEFWAEFDELIGFDGLKGLHLNDSKKELASRVDRHAPLGDGFIGWGTFEWIMQHEKIQDVPMILETPEPDRWADEIIQLRSFVPS